MKRAITISFENAGHALSALDTLQQITTGRRPLTAVERAELLETLSHAEVTNIENFPFKLHE